MIFNSLLFWAFNMKVLKQGKFSEGQHPVFSRLQCVRVIISKLRCLVLLDTFFLYSKTAQETPEFSPQRSIWAEITFCPSDFLSHVSNCQETIVLSTSCNRSWCNCCCLQFPSISYVIREKYGSIMPSPKLYINLTQSLVKSAREASLIFTYATSGIPFRRKN